MVDVAKRLFGPGLLTGSAVTKYTTPAGTTTVVKSILVCNTTGSAATLTMSIGTDAAGTEIFTAKSFAANDTVVIPCWIVLNAGDTIQALSGTASALNVSAFGVETS